MHYSTTPCWNISRGWSRIGAHWIANEASPRAFKPFVFFSALRCAVPLLTSFSPVPVCVSRAGANQNGVYKWLSDLTYEDYKDDQICNNCICLPLCFKAKQFNIDSPSLAKLSHTRWIMSGSFWHISVMLLFERLTESRSRASVELTWVEIRCKLRAYRLARFHR